MLFNINVVVVHDDVFVHVHVCIVVLRRAVEVAPLSQISILS